MSTSMDNWDDDDDFNGNLNTHLSGLPEWDIGGERNPIRYCKKRGLGNLFGPPVYVKWVLQWRYGQLECTRFPQEFNTKQEVEHDACIERIKGRIVRIELGDFMPKNNGLVLKNI